VSIIASINGSPLAKLQARTKMGRTVGRVQGTKKRFSTAWDFQGRENEMMLSGWAAGAAGQGEGAGVVL
jgi:hypothetical protein